MEIDFDEWQLSLHAVSGSPSCISQYAILQKNGFASCVFNHQAAGFIQLFQVVWLVVEVRWEGILLMAAGGKHIAAVLLCQ